jgi:hypothetical protein
VHKVAGRWCIDRLLDFSQRPIDIGWKVGVEFSQLKPNLFGLICAVALYHDAFAPAADSVEVEFLKRFACRFVFNVRIVKQICF